jgi:DNA-cytosine methyltransferase
MEINVLSLFDGISCARAALDKAGIPVNKYYASEIEDRAIAVSQHNYPDIIRLGDVRTVKAEGLPEIDLLIGGSPCQDLSIAKQNREGLDGERSGLFWEFVRILREVKPRYFILENVASMPKADKAIITEAVGVEPIMINASLVSAQQRKRLFWTNIPGVEQPEDRGIVLRDILEPDTWTDRDKSYALIATYDRANLREMVEFNRRTIVFNKPVKVAKIGKGGQGEKIYHINGKSVSLCGSNGSRTATGLYYIFNDYVRKLTPVECERLQGLPDNYTAAHGLSDRHRRMLLGNAFNVDVIAHILSAIPEERINPDLLDILHRDRQTRRGKINFAIEPSRGAVTVWCPEADLGEEPWTQDRREPIPYHEMVRLMVRLIPHLPDTMREQIRRALTERAEQMTMTYEEAA